MKGRIGFVEGGLATLWHGSFDNRNHKAKREDFQEYDFDPVRDIGIDENGIWRWTSDKPKMHEFVSRYFVSRKEDGEELPVT